MTEYKKKDFASSQVVKWCAGCGDFAVLSAVQSVLADIGRPPEEYSFVSGIGCSSRFPYYMNTYGFHTIHGRALPIATGEKIANPKQSVWVVTGDGDGMSIGGNHFVHAARTNPDLVVILLDNRIYGLTKGQLSPTSEFGLKTKSTPWGSVVEPLEPVALASGSGASFIARSTDRNMKLTKEMLRAAYEHKGFSLVHILQNCVIFNDGTHDKYTDKATQDEANLFLEHGKPMIFGKEKDKCIVLDGFAPKIAKVADVDASKILLHDAKSKSPAMATLLSTFVDEGLPNPMGIIRQVEQPVYDERIDQQIADAKTSVGEGDIAELLAGGDTWTVQ